MLHRYNSLRRQPCYSSWEVKRRVTEVGQSWVVPQQLYVCVQGRTTPAECFTVRLQTVFTRPTRDRMRLLSEHILARVVISQRKLFRNVDRLPKFKVNTKRLVRCTWVQGGARCFCRNSATYGRLVVPPEIFDTHEHCTCNRYSRLKLLFATASESLRERPSQRLGRTGWYLTQRNAESLHNLC